MPRALPTRSVSLVLAAFLWAPGAFAADAPSRPIPVILDTDIGDDIDDTWALALALKSPELDVKLVVTDFGNTEQRAKLVARVLELAGRTDIPIGIGIKENDDPGPQADWVKGYDLAKYPGRVLKDGVQALVDTAMASPEPMTLTLVCPESTLELPVRPLREEDADLAAFPPPEHAAGLGAQVVGGGPGGRRYVRDLVEDGSEWTFDYYDGGKVVLPNGWESEEWNRVGYGVTEGDPLSARVEVDAESVLRRGAQGRFHITTHGEMTCDADTFVVVDSVSVREGEPDQEREVFARTWRHEAPRDHV